MTTSRTLVPKIGQWSTELRAYARECAGPGDFLRLMRCRLSLSKVGPLVCRRPRTERVSLRSLGGPVTIRSHTSDISVLNELVVWGGYDEPADLLATPTSIVDLGANTGLAARWFRARWPGAHVVAVEPESGNLEVLRRNLATAGTRVVPVAVGGDRRTAALYTENGEFAYTLCGTPTGATTMVQVVTLPDVLRPEEAEDIGLLKVDIEGSERELFADCRDWITSVRQLIVECHQGYTASDLLADCRRGGAEFRAVHVDRKPEWGYEVVTAERVGAGRLTA
jgi:FkbM family methyltransferase